MTGAAPCGRLPRLVALVCCACLGLVWPQAAQAGLAVHFDSLRHDVISLSNHSRVFDSVEGISVEFWIRITEPQDLYAPIFTYAVTEHLAQTVSPKEVALGISIVGNVTTGQWTRGSEGGRRAILGSLFGSNSWHHVVTTLNATSGETTWFVNGTEASRVKEVVPLFRAPPLLGGELYLGWDISSDGGEGLGLIGTATLDALVDEFRLHNRVLTPAEVAAGLWAVPPPEGLPGMVLRWAFDDPLGGAEADLSGAGHHGMRGAVPRFYADVFPFQGEGFQQVTAPVMVKDDRLPVATTDCSLLVALVPAGASSTLEFQERVDVAGQPVLGSAQLLEGGRAVLYQAPAAWPQGTSFPVTFPVELSTGSCDMRIYDTLRCAPTEARGVTVAHGDAAVIRLGTICADGLPPVVEITQLPPGGRLYQIIHDPTTFYVNAGTNGDLESSLGEEITQVPATVSHPRHVVAFVATAETPDAEQQELRYRWVSSVANDSHTGTVTITQAYVNRPPRVMQPEIEIKGSGAMRIQLRSMDWYGEPFAAGVPVFYRVERGPLFGRLFQRQEDGSTGRQLGRFGLPVALVNIYAQIVPDYTAGSPSFSRQGSQCDCCSRQATCNPAGCAAAGKDYAACVEDTPFHLSNLLGPPTVYPTYSYSSRGYSPGCAACGVQWFVVGFQAPIYLKELNIYEVYNPGSIVRVSAAETYEGNNTAWRPLWAAAEDLAPAEGKAAQPRRYARRFTPPLCPDWTGRTKWIRIEMDTDSVPGIQVLDAVMARGSYELPPSAVDSATQTLMYEPLPGVVVEEDEIAVVASDCDGESAPTALPLNHSESFVPLEVFGTPAPTPIFVDDFTTVLIDVAEARAHLMSVLQEEVPLSEFSVRVLAHRHIPELYVYLDTSEAKGEGDDGDVGGEEAELGYAAITPLQPVLKPLSFQAPRDLEAGLLDILVVARRVKYHMALELQPACALGDDHDPLACTVSAYTCLSVPGGTTYNPSERRCDLKDTSGRRVVIIATSVCAGAVLLLAAVAIFAIKYATRHGRLIGGPPKMGDRVTLVITDIHGSTALWDAFPEKVAKDIAIHHECLRAKLKLCRGYEVATEGDSFKCAFHTPEEAITWCILAQLDLLCAPWELEDGGQSVLPDIDSTWANCTQEYTLGEKGQATLRNLTSLNVLDAARRMLVDGVVGTSTFSPHEASATPFSEEWAANQAKENCVVHSQAEGMLPLFRGLRVRMGIHSGTADDVQVNKSTKRLMYGGKVADIAKAVSDAPCGGQIIMTGETLAEIESMQDLMLMIARKAAGWHSALESSPSLIQSEPAAMSVMHLGSHVIRKPVNLSQELSRMNSMPSARRGMAAVVLAAHVDERLAQAHELIEVVPWPLRQRSAYYPPPTSISQVTPAWWQAPPGDNVTILFTFVEGASRMKARNQAAYSHALQQMQDVLRTVLLENNGYEVEGEGGNFVCAFHSPLDSLRFGVALQQQLLHVAWDEELTSMKEAREVRDGDGALRYKGLRMAVGMCTGQARRMQPSERTGKIEYYGPLMNHAARVAIFARGGQVLIHEKSMLRLLESYDVEELQTMVPALLRSAGKHRLKGITKPVAITAAAAPHLDHRLPQLKGAASPAHPPLTRRPTVEAMLGMLEYLNIDSGTTTDGELDGDSGYFSSELGTSQSLLSPGAPSPSSESLRGRRISQEPLPPISYTSEEISSALPPSPKDADTVASDLPGSLPRASAE